MNFNFRYDCSNTLTLGRDIIKLLNDAELNSVSLQSPDSLRMFANLLIDCGSCTLNKDDSIC